MPVLLSDPRWLLVLAGVALSGCGGASTDNHDQGGDTRSIPEETSAAELVEVPEVVDKEGQEAVDAIEAESLTASYEEADPADCTVIDQDQTGEVEPETDVFLTLDCRQRDWDNQEGEDWDVFDSSFQASADEGCTALFALSSSGSLHTGDEEELTETDCSLALDTPDSGSVEVPEEVPDDPDATGRELGFEHGCRALFESELETEFYDSGTTVTAEDCLSGG